MRQRTLMVSHSQRTLSEPSEPEYFTSTHWSHWSHWSLECCHRLGRGPSSTAPRCGVVQRGCATSMLKDSQSVNVQGVELGGLPNIYQCYIILQFLYIFSSFYIITYHVYFTVWPLQTVLVDSALPHCSDWISHVIFMYFQ